MHINFKKIKSTHCFITILALFIMFYLYNTNYIRNGRNTEKTFIRTSNFNFKWNREKDNYWPITTVRATEEPTFVDRKKYILLWTNSQRSPFVYLGNGNDVFKKKNCKYINCYITSDRDYLGDYSKFHVIAFNGPELLDMIGRNDIPKIRSIHQKYVFAHIEAAASYPICSTSWDKFFNWTWTYKLNSDVSRGYFLVKNARNQIVAPSSEVKWMKEEDMESIDDELKTKLARKKKPVAWFVSNCFTKSEREKYVQKLRNHLSGYKLYVDIYGECGDLRCPKPVMNVCLDRLQSTYYFYLAFENAISQDYVTEKVLHALRHLTVPVVYGGANYSRFLPPGSYLDASLLGPQALAKRIHEIIHNPEQYYKFFRWKKYYSIHLRQESPATDDYCQFCALVNNDQAMRKSFAYDNFSAWWSQSLCGPVKSNLNIITN